MSYNWRTIGEVIAVLSIVLSLVFVGSEFRLATSVASTENRQAILTNSLALKALIAENYEIWQKGCVGDELNETQALLFSNLIQAHSDWSFVRWMNAGGDISSLPQVQAPLSVALNMHRYPGYRDAWRKAQSHQAANHPVLLETVGIPLEIVGTPWRSEVEKLYGILQEREPNPDIESSLCGI